MSDSRIKISVDTSQVDKELHRLMLAPDTKTVVAFNALFAEISAEVDAIIHVETGSLKSTTRWDTAPYPTGWQGTIHVGGAAPGMPNDPAYYGVFELGRGGSHFFFGPAYADIPPKMIEAILDFFAGGDAKLITNTAAPSIGGYAKTAGKSAARSAESHSKHEAKKVEKKVERDLKKDYFKSEPKQVREQLHEQGVREVSGEGGGHYVSSTGNMYPLKMTGRHIAEKEEAYIKMKKQVAEQREASTSTLDYKMSAAGRPVSGEELQEMRRFISSRHTRREIHRKKT